MTRFVSCPWWLGVSPSVEQFRPIAAVESGLVWNGELGVILVGGSETILQPLVLPSFVKGMLACVVDCSQICRARSTSRKTGCESNLWPAEKEYDQDVLIRAFSSSIGYSGGSCTARSESRQCHGGGCKQSDCVNAEKDDHEAEAEGVGNDRGSDKCPQEEKRGNKKHARVIVKDYDRRRCEEAKFEKTKTGLKICSDNSSSYGVSDSDFTTRRPAKSTEHLQISLRGTQLASVEQTLRRLSESPIEVVSKGLVPSGSVRFGKVAEFADHINKGGGRRKEPQLAERRSRSQEFVGDKLDVVSSRRDERSGVQLGLSGSWANDLRESEEQLSFQRADTVECITNVGQENDFGFDVDEFQPSHRGEGHDEPLQETERLSEYHARGESSQGGQDRQRSPSPIFEGQQAQNETVTLRTAAGSKPRLSVKEVDCSHLRVEAKTGGLKIPERIEAGPERVGKAQDKDSREETYLRKSEASIVSDERRVRARLDGPAASGRGEETEEAGTKIARPTRPSGGKDRHSKVNTAKGPRDRRVRLSVPTAVQFYDVQDRLGYDQPSKAVEWLIRKAKAAIDELGRLPARGNDVSTLSDMTQGQPYSASLRGSVSGSSSCPPAGSFSNSPFGDNSGNSISYFIDSSSAGLPFGNHQVHTGDVTTGVGVSQGHLVTGQGPLAGLSFPMLQTDLSRVGSLGCFDGSRPGEFTGRVESRFKARERARERVKEKCTGRDCGKVTGSGCSTPSMQSPPVHQNSMSSFPSQNAIQSSVHSLSLQSAHSTQLQSSLSSVFETTLSGIMQGSQQGTLQNLIMQSPSLQSTLTDHVQSSLQHPFHDPLQSTLQLTSQSMNCLQNPGMHQRPHLQRVSLEGSTQRALHLGSGFTPGPCDSSSFSEAASLSPSDFMSIPSIPVSHPLSMSELSSFGLTSPSSMEPQFPTSSGAGQIPPGFSPGPPSSAFRPRPAPISPSCSKESQPHLQGLMPQCQRKLPPFSSAHGLASPGGSTSSKTSNSLYYPPPPSHIGNLQSISPVQIDSSSFSSIRNGGFDYQRLQMMSPGHVSGCFQTSSSQLQMPARIQGLDEFDELKSSPSSSNVHP